MHVLFIDYYFELKKEQICLFLTYQMSGFPFTILTNRQINIKQMIVSLHVITFFPVLNSILIISSEFLKIFFIHVASERFVLYIR
jgi:hypothetical protein